MRKSLFVLGAGLALAFPSCGGRVAHDRPPAADESELPRSSCPEVDFGRHDGKLTRLPSACEELARLRAECGLPVEDCTWDADCDVRECYLFCLRGATCERLEQPDGDASTQRCVEGCQTGVFCGGGYLEPERLCDGHPDCPSGGDEYEETQPDGSRECVPSDGLVFCSRGGFGFLEPWKVCDGTPDCQLGEDERDENCHKGSGYLCRDTNRRVERRQVCDGILDCPNGDDEPCGRPALRECPPLHPLVEAWIGWGDVCPIAGLGPRPARGGARFDPPRCESGEIISPHMRCDGHADCESGDDEADCPILCEGGECFFPCAGSDVLVPLDAVCDSKADCPLGDDEPCMDRFHCDDQKSVSFEQVCDGAADCENGADEASCPVDYFVCYDGTQILYPFVRHYRPGSLCNLPQCDDGSDMVCINPP